MDNNQTVLCIRPECIHMPSVFTEINQIKHHLKCPPIFLADLQE